MSLFVKGDKFGVNAANKTIKALGYGDSTTQATLEARLIQYGSRYTLTFYNSGALYQVGPTDATLLSWIKNVDGDGSGLDADLLRGAKIFGGRDYSTTTGRIITFPEAYTTTPTIACFLESSNIVWYSNLTTTQFKAVGTGVYYFRWLAWGV